MQGCVLHSLSRCTAPSWAMLGRAGPRHAPTTVQCAAPWSLLQLLSDPSPLHNSRPQGGHVHHLSPVKPTLSLSPAAWWSVAIQQSAGNNEAGLHCTPSTPSAIYQQRGDPHPLLASCPVPQRPAHSSCPGTPCPSRRRARWLATHPACPGPPITRRGSCPWRPWKQRHTHSHHLRQS